MKLRPIRNILRLGAFVMVTSFGVDAAWSAPKAGSFTAVFNNTFQLPPLTSSPCPANLDKQISGNGFIQWKSAAGTTTIPATMLFLGNINVPEDITATPAEICGETTFTTADGEIVATTGGTVTGVWIGETVVLKLDYHWDFINGTGTYANICGGDAEVMGAAHSWPEPTFPAARLRVAWKDV